jgi:PAS domain S-box-containing protein
LTPPNEACDPTNDDISSRPRRIEERQERHEITLLSIGDAIVITDSHGRVTLLNPMAESLTGWADCDARNLPIESVFHIIGEESRQPVSQPVDRVIELGIIQSLAERTLLISKDGSERAIDDSAAPIRDAGGDLSGVVLIFRDITERRRLEQRLEDIRLHGEIVVATVRDSLLVLDSDFRVRSVNRSFCETFGVSPEETEGRSLFDLGLGQWNIPRLRVLLEEVVFRDTAFDDFEVEHTVPSIGLRTMILNARKLQREADQEAMILLAIEDVTGRSRMTKALMASEIQYRRLFEAAQDGILILDKETGAIIDVNPFLLDLLGYSHAELLGKRPWDIGLLGDVEASQASFRELQEKGYVRYEDLPLETKDGRHVEVEFVSNIYRVNDHIVIQCNIRDITERKRVAEELSRAKEAAEEASRAKDRFIATLSHELRTPLTPVLATVAYVEMMPNLPAAVLRQQIVSIRRNVELEAQLIDDLLDVTRIGSGKLELHQEVLDIHTALRSALEVCQADVETKKLNVSLELGAEVHHVWADPARMQQVFWNLIKNAVKFTPAGGRISLRSADVGPGRVAIEVADTGIGIEPEVLPRIFDAFEQADRSITRRHGGLGLGLAIARMLVDLHGGTLTVTSGGRAGGSVFRVELETVAALTDENQPPDPASAGLPKILLVEDNADTLRTMAMVLKSSGFDVRTATSVESALGALGGELFNLLVSDIGLPDGTGLDIMRHCRDHLGLKGIAFSGYASDRDVRESEEAGFSHHLAKPADLGRMIGLATRMVS